MQRLIGCSAAAAVLVASLVSSDACAQDGDKKFRKLAPGVMVTIPPDRDVEETVSTHDVVEIANVPNLKWTPNFTPETRTLFEMSKDVKFRQAVHCLEFSFKPLRMIEVDIPQPSGKMQKKKIWYMVYKVRNPGGHLKPEKQADGTYVINTEDRDVYFTPQFVLQSREFDKEYLDRVIPVARDDIRDREDPNRPLLNSVEMAAAPIPVSSDREDKSVWGLVTWEDVDPRMDFVSLYVGGLTNAYEWVDPPGVYKHGDRPGRGRKFRMKKLQLNFWRPGDAVDEHEDEIRYGTPREHAEMFDTPPGVDYKWVYR